MRRAPLVVEAGVAERDGSSPGGGGSGGGGEEGEEMRLATGGRGGRRWGRRWGVGLGGERLVEGGDGEQRAAGAGEAEEGGGHGGAEWRHARHGVGAEQRRCNSSSGLERQLVHTSRPRVNRLWLACCCENLKTREPQAPARAWGGHVIETNAAGSWIPIGRW